MSAAPRVLGWDALRGLCALAVMAYHLMHWMDLAHLHTLGTYGVYLFFVLSGASLAYVYDGAALRGARGVASFLAARWLRLAPLYLLVCALFLWMLAARNGQWADQIAWRLLLNASFAFGLYDPTTWALAVGGWSLGIEFVFYLAMPLVVQVLPRARWRLFVLALLVAVQAVWVARTVGVHGLAAAGTAYHQVPAFAAYFFAGCLIGQAQRQAVDKLPAAAGLAAWAATAVLLLAAVPAVPGDELVSWRGVVLPLACVAVVWASGRVFLSGQGAALAVWLGDITYGTYLWHPMLFFALAWFVWPSWTALPPEAWSQAARWALLAGLVALTCTLAALGERWYERPLRAAGRRLLGSGRVLRSA